MIKSVFFPLCLEFGIEGILKRMIKVFERRSKRDRVSGCSMLNVFQISALHSAGRKLKEKEMNDNYSDDYSATIGKKMCQFFFKKIQGPI